MKRIFCLLLAAVMMSVMLPLSASAKEVTISATSIDADRGVGELVIYTPAYGDCTNTNWWGMEAVVGADHRVTELVSGKSDIPQDGFVLSGHDDESSENGSMMKTWIMQNISIGDYVYYDKRTLTVTVSDVPVEMEETVFYDVSKPVSGFNQSRGQNELVIYTTLIGDSTGTNVHGYEVVVDQDGVVVSKGGNDSAIPAGGFVVSAHGTMVTWLRSAVIDGMRAEYDQEAGTVRFVYDDQSLKTAVTVAVENTRTAIAEAKSAYVYADYKAAEEALSALETTFNDAVTAYEKLAEEAVFADACDRVMLELTDVRNSLCDSYTVQYRGVWVRPFQQTAEEVDAYVESLFDEGINMISVEGIFESGVIMELPEGSLFQKHPDFSYDVLQAYIDACHKYGIECHLWMPIMNVGDKQYANRSLLSKKPEWQCLNQNGSADNPGGFMMIDPANEEARTYLVDFYQYLVTTYDVDAFELDYIRYYERSSSMDYGYTEAAFAGFKEAYGYDSTPTYDPNAIYWEDWMQYRRDCVTDMVIAVREMIDREAPDVVLTADVAPRPDDARNNNYQDYPRWLEEGLLDVLHPMAYGDGFGPVISDAVQLGGDRTMIVTGLGSSGDSLGAAEMERQAREDNECGTYGDAYFEANSYQADKTYATLSKTVYRNPAIAPFLDSNAAIVQSLHYMKGRVSDILLPLEGVTQAQADALLAAIKTAEESVADSRIEPTRLAELHAAINALENEQAKAVLKSDLYRAERISCVVYRTTADQLVPDLPQQAPVTQPQAGNMWWIWVCVAAVGAAAVGVLVWVLVKRRKV